MFTLYTLNRKHHESEMVIDRLKRMEQTQATKMYGLMTKIASIAPLSGRTSAS